METWSLVLNHLFSCGGSAIDHSRQALSLSPAPDDTHVPGDPLSAGDTKGSDTRTSGHPGFTSQPRRYEHRRKTCLVGSDKLRNRVEMVRAAT